MYSQDRCISKSKENANNNNYDNNKHVCLWRPSTIMANCSKTTTTVLLLSYFCTACALSVHAMITKPPSGRSVVNAAYF